MSIKLSPDDYQFLQQVLELCSRGLANDQIAANLKPPVPESSMRYRMRDLGFKLVRRPFVETTLTGEDLAELIASGAIVPTEEPAAAPEPQLAEAAR